MAAPRLSMAECAGEEERAARARHRRPPQNAAGARTRRDGPRPRAERGARRLGGRAHHAHVRPVGLLRRRPDLRLLPAARQRPRPVDPTGRRRPGARAPRAGLAASPPLRATRLDRAHDRGRGRPGPRAALAAPGPCGGCPARAAPGGMMGAIRDLAEGFWSGGVEPARFWKPTGQVEEMAPGVFFLHTFANMTVVRTASGLVLIDTSNYAARERTFALVRSIDAAPIFAAIYTHGHADHALGLPPFLAEARERGWPRPRIVGHRNVAARFTRYRKTNAYNALINARQFGIAPVWPMDYDEPDVVYDDTLAFTAGEVTLELHHARGETDDHTWAWWPQRRILWTGDQFIWVAPNAGNPQKVQRYAADWAASLRAMSVLEPELLIPGHGVPILGRARVRQALDETAEWLETLERETVARMNAGAPLDTNLAEG